MRTSKRLAILTAILAAPLMAMATPSDAPKSQGPHDPCQQSCGCQHKAASSTSDASGRVDFFSATTSNPVP